MYSKINFSITDRVLKGETLLKSKFLNYVQSFQQL